MMGLALLLAIAAVLLAAAATAGLLHALAHPPRKTYAVAMGRGQPTEPEAVGLHGQDATFTLADGTSSPAWIVQGEAPAGPTVLMLHGFGDSRYGALTWAPLLTPHARQVVTFDQRGQGESTARHSSMGAREVDDVRAVMDQLEQETGTVTGGVVLFGYSMGAVMAIGAAARHDERVVGVIADGPYRHWHEPVRATLRRRRYPTEPTLALARAVLWCLSPPMRRFDRAAQAQQVPCPLLVLAGTADPISPIDSARAIAAAAPQGELVVFEGGEHLDLASRAPERYRDALQRFFDRVGG